jgi:IS5 family transposase
MAFRQSVSSFSDLSVDKRLEKVNSFLKEIDNVIDFELLRPILSKNGIGTKNSCGNKAYDSSIMFKILLLQKFYSLSDEGAELGVKTNLLYSRFVGLSIDDDVPDASTIGRFRQSLMENKLYDELFTNVNKQLEAKGLMFQTGRSIIVDATLIKSDNISITKASKDERSQKAKKVDEANAKIDTEIQAELSKPKPSSKTISRLLKKKEHNSRTLKNSEIDDKQAIDSKELKSSQEIIKSDKDGYNHKERSDKEVRTGKHSSRAEYITGYKHHVAVDATSGLIAEVTTTFANTPESTTLKGFIEHLQATEVYADKAYASKEIDAMLKEKKVTNKLCQKETKGMSQEEKQTHRENQKPISKIRAKVEHAIGTIKFEMKHTKARYIGVLRNHIDFVFLALASNLKTLAHRQLETKRCQSV